MDLFSEYPDVRVVAVIEPDSLANLVTNLSVAECSAAQATYLVRMLHDTVHSFRSTDAPTCIGMCYLCHAATFYRWGYPIP